MKKERVPTHQRQHPNPCCNNLECKGILSLCQGTFSKKIKSSPLDIFSGNKPISEKIFLGRIIVAKTIFGTLNLFFKIYGTKKLVKFLKDF